MKNKILKCLICGVMILGLSTGCGNANTDVGSGSTGKNESSKYDVNITSEDNIGVKSYIANSNEGLIVVLTNDNDYDIGSFDLEVAYYDKEGNKIEEDENMALDFKKGSEHVMMFDLPKDEDYNYYVPAKIELSAVVDKENQDMVELGTMYNDKLDISYKTNEEDISVTVKNNSGVELQTVEIAVVFMKNNKPVMVDGIGGSLDIGESTTEEVDIPIDWEKSDEEDVFVDYDSIKFVVNRAVAEY